jgi:uncharacterized membrane protein
MTPEAVLHVTGGTVALVSGAVALFARKGSRPHRVAGTAFVAAILFTTVSAVYLGFTTGNVNNGIAGIVTLYLVATSWMTIVRPPGEVGLFERGAFLFAATGAAAAIYFAYTAVMNNDPLFGGLPYVIIAGVITLAAGLDLSVVLRAGVSGRQRIARHLWRMTLGFAAAVGSFFPGQLEHFPTFIQQIRPIILLFIPFFLIIATILFWSARVLFTRWLDTAETAAPRPSRGGAP